MIELMRPIGRHPANLKVIPFYIDRPEKGGSVAYDLTGFAMHALRRWNMMLSHLRRERLSETVTYVNLYPEQFDDGYRMSVEATGGSDLFMTFSAGNTMTSFCHNVFEKSRRGQLLPAAVEGFQTFLINFDEGWLVDRLNAQPDFGTALREAIDAAVSKHGGNQWWLLIHKDKLSEENEAPPAFFYLVNRTGTTFIDLQVQLEKPLTWIMPESPD